MDDNYLIKKWLNNELTEAEAEEFKKLDNDNNYSKIIETAKYFKADLFSNVDDFETFNAKVSLEKISSKVTWLQPLLKIASVLILAVCTYFLFFNSSLTKIETTYSEKITFELPDQSEVTLNALSQVNFDKNNWGNNREIFLEGEAFFDVAKGAVFDVITPEGTVQVVGTEFNVKQRGQYFEVTCFEGIVKVTSHNNTKELLMGDTFRMHHGNFSFDSISNTDPHWMNNISDFKRVPLQEAISELERQYNITVVAELVNIDTLFTGRFVHDNLDNALKSISEPLNLTYTIENKNQVRLIKREP